jgi:hypothetical protein
MWRCATDSPRRRPPAQADRGTALFAALVVMAVVAAIGLGLALTTSLEPLSAANFEAAWSARLAAEAGVAVATHELAAIPDWNLALQGLVVSGVLEQGDLLVDLPDGSRAGLAELTDRANCGRPGPCPEGDAAAFSAPRPWGPNNPRWRVYGHGRLDRLIPDGAGLPPTLVIVWVGDDAAEADGDPFRDSGIGPGGERRPGGCVLAVRAEAFGPRFGHRTILATVARPAPGCSPGARLVSLRVAG